MKQKTIKYRLFKRILLVILLIAILLPLVQMLFPMFYVKELKGAYNLSQKTEFTWETWFDGSYQKQSEAYIDDNFGIRSDFVRIHNQVDYSLFGILNARSVLIGKENYLYEENYLKAYKGLDYVGDSIIQEKTRKLRLIQDTLEKQNKKLVVIIAPGKGSYLKEYFPAKWDSIDKGITNYEVYKKHFDKQEIQYLDFNSWFIAMKDTTSYPLYPKCGIHWSQYGEFIAADSLLKYTEQLLQRPVAQLNLQNIQVKSKNSTQDYDVGQGLNLLFPINTYPMAYPKFNIEKPESYDAPTGLFVADSYYWGMFNWGMSRDIFNDGEFWFYNEMIYPDSFDEDINVGQIDLQQKVEENDIIFLVSTDANLSKFAFGFIEKLYEVYYPETK